MALAAAAGLASCTAQSPKANLKTDVDSLSYAIGMARTEGLDQYLAQQGIDSTQMAQFLKGFNEGASKIEKMILLTWQVCKSDNGKQTMGRRFQPTDFRWRLYTNYQS